MKNLLTCTLVIFISFFALSAQDSKKVAIVKVIRGKANMLGLDGTKRDLKKGMWLKEGTIIKTSPKSFVRLSFIDKSSMNIGPKSELKIEKFSKNEAGVINVLTGKIRSQVTKDYLKMDKDKSKLFIKSRNAVMGVRGTDFLFSANKLSGTTTTVLFEGSIVFNKIGKKDNLRDLESIVNKGRKINPGEVSVTSRGNKKPTVPAKLSSKQFSKLNRNATFKVVEIKNIKKVKSIVPPGLSGAIVASDNDNLKNEIKKVVKVNLAGQTKTDENKGGKPEDSKGFIKGDDIKPADGIMVHIDSGIIISPGIDSTFDKNTGEWVSSTNGSISATGDYIPPAGFAIVDEGQMLKIDVNTGAIQAVVVMEVKPVDQMLPIDQAKTTEYIAPKDPIKGPAPAGGEMIEVQDEFNKSFDEIMNEEVKLEKEVMDSIIERSPDGEPIHDPSQDDGYLPPPPAPADCSTCSQPNTLFNNETTTKPSSPTRTRVKIKVNKQ